MTKKPAKKTRRDTAGPALRLNLSLDDLQGEPAKPPQAVTHAIDRAIEQIRAGTATVYIKGETEHQCQVQLVPLFVDAATAAGMKVKNTGLGRLRVGKSDVFFEPLYFARPEIQQKK